MGGSRGIISQVTEPLFGDAGAGAAGKAAMSQQKMAMRNYAMVADLGQKATTAGLLQSDKAIAAADRNLARQEEMVKQIDPTILEASQQALKLLKGETAGFINPLNEQRNMQRQKLLQQLREQLGPGAETSSYGMKALQNFDMQTSQLTQERQLNALGAVNQTFGTYSGYGQQLGSTIGMLGDLGQQRAGFYTNQANLLNQASGAVQQTAGAQYTADVLRGQQSAAYGQQILGAGLSMLGSIGGGTGGAGGEKKTP